MTKLSRSEFVKQLESKNSKEEQEKFIFEVFYAGGKGMGRRGVMDAERANREVHKKIDEKEKFFKFADKFAKGHDLRGVNIGGFASLKDLV